VIAGNGADRTATKKARPSGRALVRSVMMVSASDHALQQAQNAPTRGAVAVMCMVVAGQLATHARSVAGLGANVKP